MTSRRLIFFCFAFAMLIVGCVAVEGRGSVAEFRVRTNEKHGPSSDTVVHAVEAWAVQTGFVRGHEYPEEKYQNANYTMILGSSRDVFKLDVGYIPGPKFDQVLIGISARYKPENQKIIDRMFDDLKRKASFDFERL